MSRKLVSWLAVTMLVLVMVAGCGGATAEPAEPTEAPEIINGYR